MPPVVKNLILLNVILLLADFALKEVFGINLTRILGLHYFESEYFRPYQFVTHMFMHGGLAHLFFNMFALWMFGRVLESVWGPKRFLVYYFVTGLGAAVLHTFVHWVEISSLKAQMTPEQIQTVYQEGAWAFEQGKNFINPLLGKMNIILNTPTVGASGAVFGILLAFGMLFPNTKLMLLFPPIPIKAKYFVILYGGIEIYLAFSQPGSNIAHFAHIGGMLFGFILIKYWKKDRGTFY
ncbi:MAG: rhomboid family intramembrane serine protease [Bacteroidales bacterium]|nr:rhomboid family intramembrane serine protease [Bacteroidales bacterium]